MSETLYHITLPYMCAGVVANQSGMIIKAAPILRWTIGKHISEVKNWVLRKRGVILKGGTIEVAK